MIATEFLGKFLKSKQKISSNLVNDRDLSDVRCKRNQCLVIKLNELNDATFILKEALKMKEQLSSYVDTDKDLAVILQEIGRSLITINDVNDIIKYLVRAKKYRVTLLPTKALQQPCIKLVDV